MTSNFDMLDVIHCSPPYASIIPLEPHRLNQVHRRSKARAEPQDRTNVSSYFGLENCDAHLSLLEMVGTPSKST